MQPKKHQGLLGWPFWTYSLAHCWRTAHKLPSLGCLFRFLSVFPANTPAFLALLSVSMYLHLSFWILSIHLSSFTTIKHLYSVGIFFVAKSRSTTTSECPKKCGLCCLLPTCNHWQTWPRKTFIPHTFWKAQLKDLMLACVMPAWRRTYIHIEIRCAYSYTRILNSRTCNNCTMIHVTNSIH